MKRVYPVIIGVALFALVYQLSPHTEVSNKILLSMFFTMPLLVVYMAYAILKYGKPSKYTFDQRCYDDRKGK